MSVLLCCSAPVHRYLISLTPYDTLAMKALPTLGAGTLTHALLLSMSVLMLYLLWCHNREEHSAIVNKQAAA